jgi:hypothetical protein
MMRYATNGNVRNRTHRHTTRRSHTGVRAEVPRFEYVTEYNDARRRAGRGGARATIVDTHTYCKVNRQPGAVRRGRRDDTVNGAARMRRGENA